MKRRFLFAVFMASTALFAIPSTASTVGWCTGGSIAERGGDVLAMIVEGAKDQLTDRRGPIAAPCWRPPFRDPSWPDSRARVR